MPTLCPAGCSRRAALLLAFAFAVAADIAIAQFFDRAADALLAIDQQRASVVERIVATWGPTLAKSRDYVSLDDLRTRLMGLRADRLFAASLAGSEDGFREVIGLASVMPPAKPVAHIKALGDAAIDVVYTPVTPCRLVETRGTFAAVYQGDGSVNHTAIPFVPNEIRSYTVQGGNGVCLAQLPAGLNPSAVQLQVFGIPTTSASGDIEILPQGATFGSTATMVYVGSIKFNTVSSAARINVANNEISVQVRGGGAHLAIDVVGYFAAPSGNGGTFFRQGGNAFGTTATLGATDNQPLTLLANNQPVAMFLPNATSPNVISGYPGNAINSSEGGQTIAGGGAPGSCSGTPLCINVTGAAFATISGGESNRATGVTATVSGGFGNVASEAGATVSGGAGNMASTLYATVSGGNGNAATGSRASVVGGLSNTASGSTATVIGGRGNTASGSDSVAAGQNANATLSSSFVWNGWSFGSATSFRSNAFQIHGEAGLDIEYGTRRADGGGTSWVFIGSGFTDQAIATSTGAYLGTDGMWHDKSDRNQKMEVSPVDARDMLERVAALPISTWRYIDQTSGARHLGPMAQDFYASFRLGSDETTIGTIDESGVALAAIQGLHRLVQEKDARIDALEQELEAQRRVGDAHDTQIAELRRALATLLSRMPLDTDDR